MREREEGGHAAHRGGHPLEARREAREALRRIERYGVGRVDQAFVGYAALPAAAEDWRLVLGVGEYATIEQVDAAFLERAKSAHPDVGGSHDEMAKLTAARDLARKVLLGS